MPDDCWKRMKLEAYSLASFSKKIGRLIDEYKRSKFY